MGYAEPLSVVVGAPPFSALKFTYADGVMVLLLVLTTTGEIDFGYADSAAQANAVVI